MKIKLVIPRVNKLTCTTVPQSLPSRTLAGGSNSSSRAPSPQSSHVSVSSTARVRDKSQIAI